MDFGDFFALLIFLNGIFLFCFVIFSVLSDSDKIFGSAHSNLIQILKVLPVIKYLLFNHNNFSDRDV